MLKIALIRDKGAEISADKHATDFISISKIRQQHRELCYSFSEFYWEAPNLYRDLFDLVDRLR